MTRLFLLLTLLLTACGPIVPGRVAGPTHARTRPPTSTPYPTSTVLPPAATPTPAAALNPTGPWLTYLSPSKAGAEVVAANPDGSARSVIGAFASLGAPVFARPTTPGARHFSLHNGRDVSLTIFELPSGRALASIPLLASPELSADQRAVYTNILNQSSPPAHAWSPDGTRLAFIGALDGPSTDLYVYDTAAGQTLRLTEGNSEAYFPVWSPDGQWILLQELDSFQAVGFSTVRVVYAMAADGSDYQVLYRPASRGEQIYGWLSPDTFVVASRRSAGLVEARRYSLAEGTHAQMQFAGLMGSAAFDPAGAALAFLVPALDKELNALAAGLYWTTPQTGPISVAKGKWTRLEWSPAAGRFFALGPEGVLSFYPNQDRVRFEAEDGLPRAAPGGSWLAFSGGEHDRAPGLRLYTPDGALSRALFTRPVSEALWLPGGDAIYAVSEDGLYRVEVPAGSAHKIADEAENLGWVGAYE